MNVGLRNGSRMLSSGDWPGVDPDNLEGENVQSMFNHIRRVGEGIFKLAVI